MSFKRILIAVDDSTCSEKAAKTGYDLAMLHQAEVALVNIIEPSPPIANPDFGFTPMVVDAYDNSLETSNALLKEIEKKFAKQSKTTFLNTLDSPTHGILQLADSWQADLIVIGSHGRTGLNHFLMGSVAEHVARKSDCPVLIVPNRADV